MIFCERLTAERVSFFLGWVFPVFLLLKDLKVEEKKKKKKKLLKKTRKTRRVFARSHDQGVNFVFQAKFQRLPTVSVMIDCQWAGFVTSARRGTPETKCVKVKKIYIIYSFLG